MSDTNVVLDVVIDDCGFLQVTTMAFFGRLGNLLRQSANRQISAEMRSSPSFFQAVRCMSSAPSSKLFIGGAVELPYESGCSSLLCICLCM